ncbi:MAG TPA: hypothetical protein PLN21_02030 [Gemmatales bacterium]|nr:hypothetical protein [Gemmatales bacterium]
MPENRLRSQVGTILCVWALLAATVWAVKTLLSEKPQAIDPAAWGSNHVGQPIPEYVTGEQCLFCHREKIGPSWAKNRHNLTIRDVDASSPALEAMKVSPARSFAEEIRYVMGNKEIHRFLKPSQEYGHLEVLTAEWSPPTENIPARLNHLEQPHWDGKQFATSCAGCHTTAVDSKTQAFSTPSIDCYACHGNVAVEHPNKPELAHLSSKRQDSAAVITSICAQCHIRTGQSKSTGLPYPNTFVAGDNLFRDFKADFSDSAIRSLTSSDRHVMKNVRDVVIGGKESVTCLSCHDVHGQSSEKHQLLPRSDYCANCHNPKGSMIYVKPLHSNSKTCGY